MGSLKPRQQVILNSVPPDLIKGLPRSDQNAIRAVVGRPVTFVGYTQGEAEIEFVDGDGDGQTFWIDPAVLTTVEDFVIASLTKMAARQDALLATAKACNDVLSTMEASLKQEMEAWRMEVFPRMDRLQKTMDEMHETIQKRNNRTEG